MNPRSVSGLTAKGALALVAVTALAGCSSGSDDSADASTCSDLQGLAAEVRGLRDVNLVQTWVSGLQQQTDAISEAWENATQSGSD